MYIGCVETSVDLWMLVVFRLVYGYWLCGGMCMDFDCVEISVLILVVCVEISVWILVVLLLVY